MSAVEGLSADNAPGTGEISPLWLVQSARGSPLLSPNEPYILHYLSPGAAPVAIEEIRTALLPLGSVSVQVLGQPSERRFMIRMEDQALDSAEEGDYTRRVLGSLENNFGEGEVALTRSDYVGSRFSKNLTDQAGLLMGLTLLLILATVPYGLSPSLP
jgi:preprotein translocase subunit SecF